MKLLSCRNETGNQLAVLVDGLLYNAETLHPKLPGSMGMFLHYWKDMVPLAQGGMQLIEAGKISTSKGKAACSLISFLQAFAISTTVKKPNK